MSKWSLSELSSRRAESARAVTGRRCHHSGEGEDFLAHQLFFFFSKMAAPQDQKVEKLSPRWEMNRDFGPKKKIHFLVLTMFWPRPEKSCSYLIRGAPLKSISLALTSFLQKALSHCNRKHDCIFQMYSFILFQQLNTSTTRPQISHKQFFSWVFLLLLILDWS